MAAGVIRNFIQAPTPAFFPLIFQHSPCKEDTEKMLEEQPEAREGEEEREVDEEEVDEEGEAQEEEEECLEVFFNPSHYALDATKQLLRFADLISRDVQRYFGRCSGDQEACDIYSDPVAATTSGRLRYYDDLLKIARAGSPEEPDSCSGACTDDQGVSGLGPLAELFKHRGPSQSRNRPMIRRHLPLSFWTEPIPCCSQVSSGDAADVANAGSDATSQDDMDKTPPHHNTHGLEGTQLDFSDLLAYWDPNPDLTHTLMGSTHLQH